jgi:hypothetical protein
MRAAAIVSIIVVAASLGAACSGGSNTKETKTPGSPIPSASVTAPSATVPPNATAAAGATPEVSAAAAVFPARCSALVSNADIDALAAQHLALLADSVAATSGTVSQLVCRFQGSGTGADTAIIVVAAGYADAATAHNEDAIGRAAAETQGGKFTTLTGVGDEAYAFTYPAITGVAARKGSRSVSIGVGKLLGVPTPDEFNTLLQLLLGKLGS